MNINKAHKKLQKLYRKQIFQNLHGKFKKARKTESKIISLLLKIRYHKEHLNA